MQDEVASHPLSAANKFRCQVHHMVVTTIDHHHQASASASNIIGAAACKSNHTRPTLSIRITNPYTNCILWCHPDSPRIPESKARPCLPCHWSAAVKCLPLPFLIRPPQCTSLLQTSAISPPHPTPAPPPTNSIYPFPLLPCSFASFRLSALLPFCPSAVLPHSVLEENR